VDPSAPSLISFCTGYGGLELGIERAVGRPCRVLAYAEIEAFAIENLVAKVQAGFLPAAPIWSDLRTFPGEAFHGLVDILCGGYPCPPFSSAGMRAGKADPRYLWPHFRKQIRAIHPRLVFFENVEGHISLGLATVLSDLEEDGYQTAWGIFSAEEVGAPHRRKRVFIMGYASGDTELADSDSERLPNPVCRNRAGSEGREIPAGPAAGRGEVRASLLPEGGIWCLGTYGSGWPARPGEPPYGWEPLRTVADPPHKLHDRGGESGTTGGREPPDAGQGAAEPSLGGDPDGAAGRLDYALLCQSSDSRIDELRLLGNGVVPATAERAFRVLAAELRGLDVSDPGVLRGICVQM
jgi:DNA (cytosine-5)-methyltransferase 1